MFEPRRSNMAWNQLTMLGIAILGLSYVELLIVKMKQTVRVLGTIFIGCFVVLYVGYFTAVAANHNTVWMNAGVWTKSKRHVAQWLKQSIVSKSSIDLAIFEIYMKCYQSVGYSSCLWLFALWYVCECPFSLLADFQLWRFWSSRLSWIDLFENQRFTKAAVKTRNQNLKEVIYSCNL